MTENDILDMREVSSGAKVFYLVLRDMADEDNKIQKTQNELSFIVDTSSRNIRNYLTELKKAKLLISKRFGKTEPNAYFLI